MSEKDTTIWKEYVDGLAKELAAVGEQASLLGHPSLTGDAREDAIRRFFQRILPDSIGTTSGRVFDRKGNRSAEMDLILYDRHFPLVRIGHDCLVPVEAAIALFEIKSELNSEAVKDALKKCRSVADLLKRFHRLNNEEGDILFATTLTPFGTNLLVADLLEKIAQRTAFLNWNLTFWTMGDYFDPNWYLHQYVVPSTNHWANVESGEPLPGW